MYRTLSHLVVNYSDIVIPLSIARFTKPLGYANAFYHSREL